MTPAVQICVTPASLSLGARRLGTQWLEFYALLALQRREDPEAFVTVERVHRLAAWHLKQPGSVGKEIARHVASMRGEEVNVLASPAGGKTRAWRIAASAAVTLGPTPEAVEAWLAARTHVATDHLAWSRDMRRVVEAATLLRDGRAADALDVLGAARESSDVPLRAWRALSLGRAYALDGEEQEGDELDALIDEWTGCAEPSGRAVEARLRSLRAMQERFDDAARTRATLTKLVADLEVAGDAGTLGAALSVLGVLERHSGNASRALEHLTRAASLLGISGDNQLLQDALFNAAQARVSELRRGGHPPDALAFDLLDLCLTICREFRVGQDSARAEITYAWWSVESGELDRAEAMLERAREILAVSEAMHDQAAFLEVRARLRLARGRPQAELLRDLRAAARIYAEVGDHEAAARVEALSARLLGGRVR
ncbi:MAG: hypothetical protein R3A79_23910 [Nannocystaceae bacterium]